MNRRIAEAIQRLPEGRRFILAVSGGRDSQCLLKAFPHVLREVRPEAYCIAAGVNHGLRPEADRELDLARDLALSQQVPFVRLRVRVTNGSSVQAKAREARYEALHAYAGKEGFVVTAHHFDDRAETVLIRLLRGKGVGSLGVLPELAGKRFRPMIRIRREEIDSYLRRWRIPYATDPSNADPKYLRSKIRHGLLPMMESLSPRIRERLNEIADEALATSNAREGTPRQGTT